VEKKLFMKRQEERLNVASREKRRLDRHRSNFCRRPEVRSLTYVASCFISRIWMGVRCSLGEEDNEQQS
jgi:hypothetical protein